MRHPGRSGSPVVRASLPGPGRESDGGGRPARGSAPRRSAGPAAVSRGGLGASSAPGTRARAAAGCASRGSECETP
eukprot:3135970-Pyramimonas_sp.AAC.1